MFDFSVQITQLLDEETRLSAEVAEMSDKILNSKRDYRRIRKARVQLQKISGLIPDSVDEDDYDDADIHDQ